MALIPARAGSKRFPGKNLAVINGKSLVRHAIEQAEESQWIDNIVVLSSDKKVKKIAGDYFHQEPEFLCGDYVQPEQYIKYIESKYDYNILVLLQPSSFPRTSMSIDHCISMLICSGVDSVITANRRVSHHFIPNGGVYVMRRGKTPYNDNMAVLTVECIDIDYKKDLEMINALL